MKKSFSTIAVLLMIVSLMPEFAFSQAGNNEIGIYTSESPDVTAIDDYATVNGVVGVLYTAYVVCLNPYNDNLDQPIANVSCAEFRLEWGDLVVNYDLPVGGNIFTNPPDFIICSAPYAVVDGMCTLLTLHIGSYTGDPEVIYITPIQEYPQTIEGAIAVTDFDDDYSISQAYPSSGDFENPVFGFNTAVVPDKGASWSDVKVLYR